MSITIDKKVGDNKPIRWTLTDETTGEPVILTGHTLNLEVTFNEEQVVVSGVLYEGDAGVYFEIPSTINSIKTSSMFRLIDINDGEQTTVAVGQIQYS